MVELQDSDELQESPLYNLSLSSLENFHTAFLVWLNNNYKKEFLSVFKDIFKSDESDWEKFKYIFDEEVSPGDIKCEAQKRVGEGGIIDIKITVFEGGRKSKDGEEVKEVNILIENKIKSYPSQEQINKYHEELKKKKYEKINTKIVLLTLDEINIDNCSKIVYKELSHSLQKIF